MAAPEPRGAARLPTEAATVQPGMPVLAMAASRARRARVATKPVHWRRRVEEEVVIGHGVKIANAMGRACAASTCRCVTVSTAI